MNPRTRWLTLLLSLTLALAGVAFVTQTTSLLSGVGELGGTTVRVSARWDGEQGNAYSDWVMIAARGRYVTFHSFATNLVAEPDTNDNADIFVHDLQTHNTIRVSKSTSGTQANNRCNAPVISADGRYVAFSSIATNLVPFDTNAREDIFVHDTQTGVTERVSLTTDGGESNGNSGSPSISGDGRYVAFDTTAALAPGDINGTWDIYVRNRQTNQMIWVSVPYTGTAGNAHSPRPYVSTNGCCVVFLSAASNIVPNDTNGAMDVFVRNLETHTTVRVSVASDGTEADRMLSSYANFPVLSGDGRYAAFYSNATNLVPGDTNGRNDIFVHDLLTGVTERVSVASDGTQANGDSLRPALSGNGRFVTFESAATNLVEGDTNGQVDIFLHDRYTHKTYRISTPYNGFQTDGNSWFSSLSADGSKIAFVSSATNLVAADLNGCVDSFVYSYPFLYTSRIYLPLTLRAKSSR